MTASENGRWVVISRVAPETGPTNRISCGWRLTNQGAEGVVVSFHLHSSQALLAELTCPAGRVQRGCFHGSASFEIGSGEAASVSAVLEPRAVGPLPVHIAVLSREETIERHELVELEASTCDNSEACN
jgi:hypothetical protein